MDPAQREAVKEHIAPHYRMVDIPRCAAEQYPRLALGENDVSIFERTLAWDHAAGALWLNEAGGKVGAAGRLALPRGRTWDRTGLDRRGHAGIVGRDWPRGSAAAAGTDLELAFDPALELALGRGAQLLGDRLAILEQHHQRDRLHADLAGNVRCSP